MKRDIQCAATSFLRVEKGRKETPGASPLVPQIAGRFSFYENRRKLQKGGLGPPGTGWARGRKKTATPSPGAATPFCIEAGSGVGVRVDFHRENPRPAPERHSKPAGIGAGHPPLWCPTMALKIKTIRGSKGTPLGTSLPSFFVRRKKVAFRPNLKKTGMAICPLTRCDYILNALMP